MMESFVVPLWLKIAAPIVLVLAVLIGIKLYGNSRYHAGVSDTDAKWEEASNKLKAEAAKSATKADDKAAQRLEEFVEQSKEDQEKVDEAVRNGTSPLDELFGS